MLMVANIQHGTVGMRGIAAFFAVGDRQHAHYPDYDPTPQGKIASETYYFAVAAEGDTAVGCAALNQDTGEIERLFVREDRRHQGIAKALLAYLEKTAEIQGIPVVSLYVLNTNAAAISLYIKAGYVLRRAEGNFLFFEKGKLYPVVAYRMNKFQRFLHYFIGHRGWPNSEGNVYCARCGHFMWGCLLLAVLLSGCSVCDLSWMSDSGDQSRATCEVSK